ncbi:hypothetical protein D9757_003193 [Collybiopsis confluens]|uniref:RRM domain-containing protein n=1 Tax=Collybiopsis confluens TaxID=2823264 RepID=A0A8H5HZ67_9AGAR|nr:hypothetical protein D9757_003193 [Collybiopsis confluens]
MFASLRSVTRTSAALSRPASVLRLTGLSSFASRLLSTSAVNFAPRFVYLGNLPWRVQIDEIKEHAEKFGPLLSINIPNNETGSPAGFANVEFESAEDAQNFQRAAIESQISFANRRARVELFEEPQDQVVTRTSSTRPSRASPPTTTLWIGSLPPETQPGELREIFEKYGSIKRISVSPMGRSGTHFAHVEYHQKADAQSALADLSGSLTLRGTPLSLDFAAVRSDPPSNKLYVTAFDGEEGELREIFRKYSDGLTNLVMLRNRNAVIEYEDVEQASAAKDALDFGKTASGGEFRVFFSNPRPVRPESNSSRNMQRRKSYGNDW